MSRNNDTLFRQWFMLTHIPRYPQRISASEVKIILGGEGYEIDIRTIQRDLDKLSSHFPLNYDIEGRTNYWYWIKDASTQILPGMDPATAIAFYLAESYLTPLLPQSTLELLAPYFKRSGEVLENTQKSNLKSWPSKISAIPRGQQLTPPSILPDVQYSVYEGLFRDRMLKIEYKPKSSNESIIYEAHPLGIVVRQGVIYLVCTLWKYADVKQLALHRMSSVELTNENSKKIRGFILDDYVNQHHEFSYPINMKPIKLEAKFDPESAKHLYETPLSTSQSLIPLDDGRILLKATIIDTHELRWWLQGFGSYVEVTSPKHLRIHFRKIAKELSDLYR